MFINILCCLLHEHLLKRDVKFSFDLITHAMVTLRLVMWK